MTLTKLTEAPSNADDLYGGRGVYNPQTNTSAILMSDKWPMKEATQFVITSFQGIDHAEGEQSWYTATSFDEANTFMDHIKSVEVEG